MSKEPKSPAPRRPGRPRSSAARAAVLKAAREILEAEGPGRLTIEAVARRAGVGKPTIYRSWANAQELAMAALVDGAGARPGATDDGTLAGLVEDIVTRLNSRRGRQMALMLAGAEADGELFKAFSNRVVLEGRKRGLEYLAAAQQQGKVDKGADIALAMDMVFGAVFLRLLLRHAPLDEDMAGAALDLLWQGIGEEPG